MPLNPNQALNKQLIRYSPQQAASTLESPQYSTTLERDRMDEHGADVIRLWRIFFWGGGVKLVSIEKYITQLELRSVESKYFKSSIYY